MASINTPFESGWLINYWTICNYLKFNFNYGKFEIYLAKG